MTNARSRMLVIVGAAVFLMGQQQCKSCPGPVPDPDVGAGGAGGPEDGCADFDIGAFEYPEYATVYPKGDEPPQMFEHAYLNSFNNMTAQFTPTNVGFAFRMSMRVPPDRPFLDIGIRTFLFQYDLPSGPCAKQGGWNARPELTFPNGYLILPRQGEATVRVDFAAFVDSSLDLRTASSSEIDEALQWNVNIGDPNLFQVWSSSLNGSSNTKVAVDLSGDVTLLPNDSKKLFVAVTVGIWANPGAGASLTSSGDAQVDLREGAILRDRPEGERYGPSFLFTRTQ